MMELSKRKNDGMVELPECRIVEYWNGGVGVVVGVVESSSGGMVEWLSSGMVEWRNGGVVEASSGGMVELSNRRMAE